MTGALRVGGGHSPPPASRNERVAVAVFGGLLLAPATAEALGLDAVSRVLAVAWLVSGAGVPLACLLHHRRRPGRANTLATASAVVGYAAVAACTVLVEPAPTDIGGGLIVLVALALVVVGGLASRPPKPQPLGA